MTKLCVKCKNPTDLLAWRLLKNGRQEHDCYLVCHGCKLARPAFQNAAWTDMGAHKKADKPEWIKHTPYHWQMHIGGEILDYWQGKTRKYRWRGQTYLGNPDIKRLMQEAAA